MPWRLPAREDITFPLPVSRKRFLAPDLVFILGIWLSCAGHEGAGLARGASVLCGHEIAATAALWPGGERPAYGRRGRFSQPGDTVSTVWAAHMVMTVRYMRNLPCGCYTHRIAQSASVFSVAGPATPTRTGTGWPTDRRRKALGRPH